VACRDFQQDSHAAKWCGVRCGRIRTRKPGTRRARLVSDCRTFRAVNGWSEPSSVRERWAPRDMHCKASWGLWESRAVSTAESTHPSSSLMSFVDATTPRLKHKLSEAQAQQRFRFCRVLRHRCQDWRDKRPFCGQPHLKLASTAHLLACTLPEIRCPIAGHPIPPVLESGRKWPHWIGGPQCQWSTTVPAGRFTPPSLSPSWHLRRLKAAVDRHAWRGIPPSDGRSSGL
jgi:hypothetical protein